MENEAPPITFKRWAWNPIAKDEAASYDVKKEIGYHYNESKKIDGFVLKWTINLYSDKGLMLSSIAYDGYTLTNAKNISNETARQILSKSYWRIKEAFEEKIKTEGYDVILVYDIHPLEIDEIVLKLKSQEK
ncbi:MAG TPA: hypothetical protein VM888_05635 [Chitinophagaceae bacterium]|nr:hypothetical protein [Chitinophagaceae bacterium]